MFLDLEFQISWRYTGHQNPSAKISIRRKDLLRGTGKCLLSTRIIPRACYRALDLHPGKRELPKFFQLAGGYQAARKRHPDGSVRLGLLRSVPVLRRCIPEDHAMLCSPWTTPHWSITNMIAPAWERIVATTLVPSRFREKPKKQVHALRKTRVSLSLLSEFQNRWSSPEAHLAILD